MKTSLQPTVNASLKTTRSILSYLLFGVGFIVVNAITFLTTALNRKGKVLCVLTVLSFGFLSTIFNFILGSG